MRNAFLFKNWLNFRNTQFLTQNRSKPSKTLVSTQNIEKPSLEQKKVFLNLPLMRNTFLNKKPLNFTKRQFSTQNGVKASKTVVSTQDIEKSNLAKVFLKLQLMRNAFLNKKLLQFSRTRFLTQNGVKPGKILVSTQNIEQSSLAKKWSFSTYT